ncbi:MAG: hypothetical protein AABX01_08050 [Candidatus Micrarchaeota archaeon]
MTLQGKGLGWNAQERGKGKQQALARKALHRALEGRVMYQTLKVILGYLEKSDKITYVDGKIVWIFTNEKLDNAIKRGMKY